MVTFARYLLIIASSTFTLSKMMPKDAGNLIILSGIKALAHLYRMVYAYCNSNCLSGLIIQRILNVMKSQTKHGTASKQSKVSQGNQHFVVTSERRVSKTGYSRKSIPPMPSSEIYLQLILLEERLLPVSRSHDIFSLISSSHRNTSGLFTKVSERASHWAHWI